MIQTLRHWFKKLYSLENVILLVAVVIALSWAWGTMDTLQNNFRLQGQVNGLKEEVTQSKLEADNLALENQYYASDEYLELEARERLNKAAPGEHLLLLPKNTPVKPEVAQGNNSLSIKPTNNFQAWLNFFFGKK